MAAGVFNLGTWSQAFTAASDSPSRTSTTGMPTDSRREITMRTRLELVKKSRWLNNNLGLFRRFTNGTSRYAVGSGIVHIPDTQDEAFNKAADKYFEDWASNEIMCDVRGRVSFWRMQKYLLRAMVRDGDSFVLKTPTKDQVMADGRTVPGRPQLQWLESTMVGNRQFLSNVNGFDDEGYRDGILATAQSKVIRYKILQDTNPLLMDQAGDPITVPAEAMRHLFDSERATSLRGLPWGYHGMNSGLDILDLTTLEKQANKLHSAMAAVIKRRSGDKKAGFGSGLRKLRPPELMARRKSPRMRTSQAEPVSSTSTSTRNLTSRPPTAPTTPSQGSSTFSSATWLGDLASRLSSSGRLRVWVVRKRDSSSKTPSGSSRKCKT
jgi:capsid protein